MNRTFNPDQVRYELEHKLGEGLNSNVWRAKRKADIETPEQTVALKLPKDQTSVPFLRREFETLTRINSMHVVRALAWESCNGEPALALEWIDGVTLQELAQKIKLTRQHRDEIVRQIDQALDDIDKAHACHGDLHPGNVMIDKEGRVRLIDFASGKNREMIQATPAFVDPEILKGAEFSVASDRFALKVIREYMLDGYRSLPPTPKNPSSYKTAGENSKARADIARMVGDLTRTATQTQTIAHKPTRESRWHKQPASWITAAGLVLAFAIQWPVQAEDPKQEPHSSAQILVTSQSWMEITVNGKTAGFAPLRLTQIKSGLHHLEWKSAKNHGEFHLNVHAGDTLRLTEKNGRLELR